MIKLLSIVDYLALLQPVLREQHEAYEVQDVIKQYHGFKNIKKLEEKGAIKLLQRVVDEYFVRAEAIIELVKDMPILSIIQLVFDGSELELAHFLYWLDPVARELMMLADCEGIKADFRLEYKRLLSI